VSGASNPKPEERDPGAFSPETRDPTDRGVGAAAPCSLSTWCRLELGHGGDCEDVNRPKPPRVRLDLAGYFGTPQREP